MELSVLFIAGYLLVEYPAPAAVLSLCDCGRKLLENVDILLSLKLFSCGFRLPALLGLECCRYNRSWSHDRFR